MTTIPTTTNLPCTTTIQGCSQELLRSMVVVSQFLWFSFDCSYSVALGENFKAKAGERICEKAITPGQTFHYKPEIVWLQFMDCTNTRGELWGQIHSLTTRVIVCNQEGCGWKWARPTTATIEVVVCKRTRGSLLFHTIHFHHSRVSRPKWHKNS